MADFEATSRTIELDGKPLHYNEQGDGPVLFAFHGGGPGANGWDNTKWNIDALSRRFRMILVDLPGYGASHPVDACPGESPEEMYGRVLLALMDALGIAQAHFYGASMSCQPVVWLAANHPDRVLRLILKTPPSGPNILTPTPPDGISALFAFIDQPTRDNMAQVMRLFVPKPGLLTDAMIDARFNSAIAARKMPPAKVPPGASLDMRPLLARLSMPVLVLWGHQDRMVPLDGALAALALIPDVRIHLWGGGTGHFIEYEHPDEFNRQVTDFLLA